MTNNRFIGTFVGNLPSPANTVDAVDSQTTNLFGTFKAMPLRLTVAAANAGGITVKPDGKVRSNRLRIRIGVTADVSDETGTVVTVGPSTTFDLALTAGQTIEEGKFYSLEAALRHQAYIAGMSQGELIEMISAAYDVMNDFAGTVAQNRLSESITTPLIASVAG